MVAFHTDAANIGKPALSAPKIVDFLFITSLCVVKKRENTSTKLQNAGGDNYRKLFVYMADAAKKRQNAGGDNYRKLFVYMAGAAKKRQNAGGNRFLPSRTRPDERGVCFRRNGHICLPRCPYILTVVAIYTHHGSHIYSPR
ncbi:hypothetical protein HMPREF1981_03556 [Bacteroides pyogenes F0041]|uniref:Uncharacterized protein n=1 Tax=Bacteroides pyogenes F0041 TaxID=1321819 RepID=U2BRP0_9BACE|nr:hypothetical protein HMPREF1981_03556 [Bacteroides pyogenes F0041]GAE22182.1 hypothetical protein JCM10003_1750 [Bacteroides pyogenes JCM 10003]